MTTGIFKGSILIIDDAPNNLRLLSKMLIQQGYDVRSALSGLVALQSVHAIAPDLILLDIAMPQMDGYRVCETLKADAQTQDIPVIFLSAMDDAIDKVRAFQVGAIDYITKPFQIEEVMIRIENQLMLRRTQLELQQAKIEALLALEREKELSRLKSEFVSMISHDFRTPLTSIQGFTELLQLHSHQLTSETRQRYCKKIDAAIEHLLHLLDQILLIGSTEATQIQCHPTLLDLKTFCSDLAETLQLNAGNQHPILFRCTGDYGLAELDTTLLRQVLTNLLSNAIKYSVDDDPIEFTLHCQDGLANFQIRDRGIGIPAENLAQLFAPFYRAPNVGYIKGSGLGLAVVKRCVDALQGQIQVESQETVGTTVTVTLPLGTNAIADK